MLLKYKSLSLNVRKYLYLYNCRRDKPLSKPETHFLILCGLPGIFFAPFDTAL